MPEMMKSIVLERFGEPSEVLEVREVPVPSPGRHEVRVRMIASPINPSDLLTVQGKYVALPPLPATPGFEGVGIVDAAGPGLLGRWVMGKRVVAINDRGGNWAEYAIIKARQARPVPADLPDDQVASLFVNPMTALALVRHVMKVKRGEWLLQSAAGSNLGRMIIRMGKHDGFKTINVVRRHEAMEELKQLGGDVVLCSEDGPIDKQVKSVAPRGVAYAVDPVGGETGTQLLRSLTTRGRLVIFGSLSEEPIRIDPRLLIGGQQTIEGFWLGHWMRAQSIPRVLRVFREVSGLIRSGVLKTETGPGFTLDEVKQAAAAGGSGKALLWLDPSRRPS
jgi:NADPH:quinone reductase-like Zn-dependent oxidoreductase